MRKLKLLFILGWAISIILVFVPYKRMKVGGIYGIGGEERTVSLLQETRLLAESTPLISLFMTIAIAIFIAFLVLAIKYPKRWVFLSGAIFMSFFFLLSLFSPPTEGEKLFLIPRVIDFISTAFILTGYFIKPEKIEKNA